MADPLEGLNLKPKLDDPPPGRLPSSGGATGVTGSATGVTGGNTEVKQRKTRSDKGKPRGPRGSRAKAYTPASSDSELREALEEILVMPSVPAMFAPLPVHTKIYLLNHYTMTAPWGANKLVQASKMSPALRRILEGVREKSALGVLVTFGAVWAGGPALALIGRQGEAEAVTAMSSVDESALKLMAEQALERMMNQMMMSGMEQAQNGSQTQPEPDPAQSEAEPSGYGAESEPPPDPAAGF